MQPFSIRCPECQATLRIEKAELIGKRVRCPRCKTGVPVTRPGKRAEPPAPAPSPLGQLLEEESSEADDAASASAVPLARASRSYSRSPVRENQAGTNWGLVGLIGGGAIGVVVLIIVVTFATTSRVAQRERPPEANQGFVGLPNATPAGPTPVPPRMQPRSAAPAASASAWTPDPALLEQLQPESPLPDYPEYLMRLPPDFKIFQSQGGVVGTTIVLLINESKPGQTMTVAITRLPEEISASADVDSLGATIESGALETQANLFDNWQQSPAERLTANGLTFSRTSWNGIDKATNRKVYGVQVHVVDRQTIIAMGGRWTEASDPGAELIGTSVMTLRKASTP